jgi:hypothetical protein
MNSNQVKSYFNKKPVEFVVKQDLSPLLLLKEDKEFIPRFNLKNITEIEKIPINEPIKYSEDIMIKAIKYGMIFLINYKGEKDKHFSGHERVIYPMVLGRSSKGNILLRGWHLNGWSVSAKRHINKIWRLFRADRILSMTFTGSFYRLAPSGYNMNDMAMRGRYIARADFSEIRRNQQKLVKINQIQNKEEITLTDDDKNFATVMVKDTNTKFDILDPFSNAYINNVKDLANIRLTFLKSIFGNKYIALLGSLGKPGNTVKVLDDSRKQLGTYKVLDSISGETLKKIKKFKGNSVYDLYIFDKKI